MSRPQSIAAEIWLPFQVCKFLYLIQISPEVRNELENVVFKIKVTLSLPQRIKTSRQRQYGRYFADEDFKFIFKYNNCTFQFETWRLFCLRHNHWTQVIYMWVNGEMDKKMGGPGGKQVLILK